MKTAVYFTSQEFHLQHVEKAIEAVTSKKDKWLVDNVDSIGNIDGEDIFFHYYGSQNERVFVTIKFNYYTVEK